MSDADSDSGQSDRQLPTLELGKRLKERGPFLLSCLLVLVCFLVATIFGITGLWQAWADGRWDSSYWVESFLLLVVVPLVTAARAMLPLIAYFSRGQQYICYVNDQFIGIYQDSGPARGPVGLDVQTQTASVTFTDFTIYPL